MSLAPHVEVTEPPKRFPPDDNVDGVRPSHHLNDSKTMFGNPWPSFRYSVRSASFLSTTMTVPTQISIAPPVGLRAPRIPNHIKSLIPNQIPTWGTQRGNESTAKATWLGHACYFVELPTPPGALRGVRIIFDPVFSKRCSPSRWFGPARYTGMAPWTTDVPTLRALLANPSSSAHIFVGLNNAAYLSGALGVPSSRIHELDWWDERLLGVALPSNAGAAAITVEVRLSCTPSQHVFGRAAFDRWHALWAAWVIDDLQSHKKLYFAGDTGYHEDKVPVCPAFAQVGERFGGIDVALLPIGAYSPRAMWSNLHASPADAVRMFKDVKAKKALAMHWGTWVLTLEPVLEPPEILRKECEKAGLGPGDFLVPALGETVSF
ncbi:N-acyl-phosphatidylethanolamine-hydrolyzing phospholipase D [Lactarius vividus]|nr:N-acyl-phosphatidylethanolamine-hydrolyzing phospholipase D [Lactarius vividus]